MRCCCSIRSEPSRRHAVLLAAGFLASACGSRAHASMEGWDGSSAALGSCPIGDEGDECRKRLIMCGLPLLNLHLNMNPRAQNEHSQFCRLAPVP